MLGRIKEFVKNNQWAQFALVLLLGIAIGAIFYPTKRIEERLTQKHEEEVKRIKEEHTVELEKTKELYTESNKELKEYREQSESKITKLTSEVRTLKSKQKTAFYKVVRPDGTIEIKKFSETEVDESTKVVSQIQEEFKKKVESIEQKWSDIHKQRVTEIKKEFDSKEQEYKKQIDELNKSKVVEINKKNFGIEAGMLTNLNGYVHATYDIFGPLFIGLQAQLNPAPTAAGAGIGLRL